MKKKENWPYKPYEPLNLSPGKYQIWIFARHTPGPAHSPGKSGCAWEIRDEHDNIVTAPEPLVTENDQSSQWRGYIAAATRGLELIPAGSELTICSKHETILQSIEAVDEYKANGWKNKKAEPIADVDIWERFLLARAGYRESSGRKAVKTRKAISELDKAIIKRLQKDTQAAMDCASGQKKRRG